MHIHFWWACIDTSVPLCWEWTATGVASSLKRCSSIGKEHQGCSQQFKESGMSTFGAERKQGCWQHGGSLGSWCLVASSMGDTHQSSVCVGWPMRAPCSSCSVGPPFVLCCPTEHEQPVLGSAQQWLPVCQLLTVPDICDDCSGIFALPYYRKGSPFTIFLYKIWSCLVVWTKHEHREVLGVLNLALYLAPGYYSVSTCFSSALESC